MQKKTLVILMGSCRGGKAAWKTQKKYLFDHLDADIALCFGDVDKIDDYLLNIAKYQWLQKDYDNWDSFAHLNIITFAESKFDITFSLDESIEIKSANDLLNCINSHLK